MKNYCTITAIFAKGLCKSATDVNLHKNAVWICRGRFGRLDLNCSGNQTIKTSQMISCQAAIIYRPTEAEYEEGNVAVVLWI